MYTQKKRLTLSPKEVEAEYGFLVGTLQAWRDNGKGPPYAKCESLVKYQRDELEAWIEANKIRPTG
jgi:Helix-turn-helix domain